MIFLILLVVTFAVCAVGYERSGNPVAGLLAVLSIALLGSATC